MNELVISLHMHTTYSDGSGSHKDIAAAALKAGLDAVIVTDHNVLVTGPEGYYKEDKRRMLLLIGEEVHDQARQPQRNHLLVFNARREMAAFVPEQQNVVDNVRKEGGISFIAHLYDPACPPIKETDISWEDWQVQGYTGIELWNSLSELKIRGKSFLHILFYVFFPQFLAHQPPVEHLTKWDELLNLGRKVVAIGGADAHAIIVYAGPIRRSIFPYEFHFRGITTHLLTPTQLTGDLEADSITLKVKLPQLAECRLLKNGQVIQTWQNRETCTHITSEPGVYRVEVYRRFLGLRRGWIFSNPIYVR
ncbi:MAG: CehA/McbA family metallohydrolase [Chloroflexi bacterium]|nr:CehA/McbA family metallohydrolase [Chloroflexota bacterium]